MTSHYTLRVQKSEIIIRNAERVMTAGLEVFDERFATVAEFSLMCSAIFNDVQTAKGSGNTALEEIRRIEAGEVDKIESDGNAWVAHITKDRVWFESLYNQGEGGEVSFAQYKLAVQTYVRFLEDPQHRMIEVPFPLE